MKKDLLNALKTHAISIVVFLFVTLVYFPPVLEGKSLMQTDKVNFIGASKEIVDHRADYDEEPLWTNSMFGGMPAYQISVKYSSNMLKNVQKIFELGLPRPASQVFLYLLGFYFLLITLSIDYRLAIVGALAFAFSAYLFIIIEAGHNTKAIAIAYMAPLLASVLMTFRGRWLLGGSLTALFTSLMLNANHFQITYYLIMLFVAIGFTKLFFAVKSNAIKPFLISVAILIGAGTLGTLTNVTRIMTTVEYGEDSIRGKSDLSNVNNIKTSGLDKDYATQWSYGLSESFTLLIPNFNGGSSQGELSKKSETYKAIKQSPQASSLIKNLPLYWGDQPFTSGPRYVGAIICFLFLVGMFILKGPMRIWVIAGFIFSLTLSWGKNFMPLTEFFLECIPGYNKFRAVSTILVILELLMPLFAMLALNKIINDKSISFDKPLKTSFYIVGGFSLFFALFPNLFFDFEGISDQRMESMGWPIDAIQADRLQMFTSDAWRSFILISLAFALIWSFLRDKINKSIVIFSLGILVLGDMWMVNKRYLNNENFTSKRKSNQPFNPSTADQQILQDLDPNFRVFNTTVSTFNDASTSYYHKSIGGYHGAKLKRYQELIDTCISKGNMNVLNMLNTKYFIISNNNQKVAQLNRGALGNVWFIDSLIVVPNADKEISVLKNLDTKKVAVSDEYCGLESQRFAVDSLSQIKLTGYKANHLVYESNTTKEQFAVFSEIFYDKGWNAYLDGKLVDHVRVNYVLRGMSIPKGKHQVEFKFEPKTYYTGEKVAYASSIALIILLIFAGFKQFRN